MNHNASDPSLPSTSNMYQSVPSPSSSSSDDSDDFDDSDDSDILPESAGFTVAEFSFSQYVRATFAAILRYRTLMNEFNEQVINQFDQSTAMTHTPQSREPQRNTHLYLNQCNRQEILRSHSTPGGRNSPILRHRNMNRRTNRTMGLPYPSTSIPNPLRQPFFEVEVSLNRIDASQFTELNISSSSSFQMSSMSSEEIDQFTTVYKKIDNLDQVCVICMCALMNNEIIRKLQCRHCYHVTCIDKWLGYSPTCPSCRKQLKRYTYGRESEAAQEATSQENAVQTADTQEAAISEESAQGAPTETPPVQELQETSDEEDSDEEDSDEEDSDDDLEVASETFAQIYEAQQAPGRVIIQTQEVAVQTAPIQRPLVHNISPARMAALQEAFQRIYSEADLE